MDTIQFEGILRIRELPEEWTPEEYKKYWTGTHDRRGRLLIAPVLSARERDRYTVVESHNQLMTAGRAQILAYLGGTAGNSTAFGKYLAIGTGTLQATSPADTALVNEVYRVAQTANTVQGSQIDISFSVPAASAQVTMTEAGLYGGTASGTSGSGTLVTHVQYSYTKGNYSISADYLINLL